jgi:hypothetical protein
MYSPAHELEAWELEMEVEGEAAFEAGFEAELEYLIGDRAQPANQGVDPNPHHDNVLSQLAGFVRQAGWGDIRREQPQVAGTANAVEATERTRDGRGPGMNFPDLAAIDPNRQRTHIEVDTDRRASLDHQARIFAADRNPALGNQAGQARGVFVVINPRTGLVTSVRHVQHGRRTQTRRYAGGVPLDRLLTLGVLNAPVSARAVRPPRPARARQQRQREFELGFY